LIRILNQNDVLTGRGNGPNDFVGNLNFRSSVEARKEDYRAAHKNKAKQKIAREIMDQIHDVGGRFLKEIESGNDERVWCQVEETVALAKCKQALRDLCKKRPKGDVPGEPAPLLILPMSMSSVLPLLMMGGGWAAAAAADARFSDFQNDTMVPQPQGTNTPNTPSQFNQRPQARSDMNIIPDAMYCPVSRVSQTNFTAPEHGRDGQGTVAEDQSTHTNGSAVDTASPIMSKENDASAPASEDLSEFMLSVLEAPDRPSFTEEQIEKERDTQTDEERADALSDLFGKQCQVNIHQRKRAREDLDQNSIGFLVQQMRLELERIPQDKKRALTEAQETKWHADEFSDARLERFLRCEGMNVKVRLEV
jgi:hypothetical protein